MSGANKTTADKVADLLSRWSNTYMNDAEAARVIALLDVDPSIDKTMFALQKKGLLNNLFTRIRKTTLLRRLIGTVAIEVNTSASIVKKAIMLAAVHNARSYRASDWFWFSETKYFDVCFDLHRAAVKHGFAVRGRRKAMAPRTWASATRPFSGAGASGVNPTTLSVPAGDMARLAMEKWVTGGNSTTKKYHNPVGNLGTYLAGLTPQQRVGQAKTLIRQPISSVFPHAYDGRVPLRSQVFHAAGKAYNLEPSLIAAFILAEQRDQSKNEDAKDMVSARYARHNASIGLGQILVTTAKKYDVFSDLLSGTVRKSLTRQQIISLLASDEFNIFGTAKYIRWVADQGAMKNIKNLPKTKTKFPGIDLMKFKLHSKHWPSDNKQALASEYTSRPWDDKLSPGWGWFVNQGFQTIQNSAINFP